MPEFAGGAFVPTGDYGASGETLNSPTISSPTITSPTITGTTTIGTGATLTTPTLVTPLISTGLTASGSAANTFAGSTGTFLTSTGTNTLSGSVTIAANKNLSMATGTGITDLSSSSGAFTTSTGAVTIGPGATSLSGAVTLTNTTTPTLALASGSTNTGTITVNGKTSGKVVLTTADATAQTVTISPAAQTSGAVTLTTPDFVGVNDTFAFITKAQTLSNKTLDVTSIWQPAKCLSTQTFTSNATLTNLTGLSWTVAASGVYYVRVIVPALTQTTTGGSQMAFKLTTATLTQISLRVWQSTDTDNTGAISTSFTTTTDAATWFNQKAVAYTYVAAEGMLTVGTGGTIAIQAAQNTSAGGGDATIFAGTSAQVIRVS
jgi:hypothetical protein